MANFQHGGHALHGGTANRRMTPEYQAWINMRRRCTRTDPAAYPYYLAKGITVCERWAGSHCFPTFLADVGPRPGRQYSLDRINPDKNYEPSNVRWATPRQQAHNRGVMHRATASRVLKRILAETAFRLGLAA